MEKGEYYHMRNLGRTHQWRKRPTRPQGGGAAAPAQLGLARSQFGDARGA